MKYILASYLDLWDKDEFDNRTPKNFGNKNQILDNIKKYVKKYDNLLFVASSEYDSETTDFFADLTFKSFELTLPFKNYYILDSRTENKMDELLEKADLIFLCGGHVPTQNQFFHNIDLKNKIKNLDVLIIGGSAGAMNMADNVYCPPELEGESIDPNFKRDLKGIGLTNINVFPHYDECILLTLDDKKMIEEIVLPDTFDRKVYGINNGSYILITDKSYLYGEGYLLYNGLIKKINDDDNILVID